MARPPKTDEGTGSPISIRLTEEIQNKLEDTAKRLGLPVSAVMRLCFQIGIEHFRRAGYDIASAVIDASIGQQTPRSTKNTDQSEIALVAESGSNIVPLPPRKDVSYTPGQRKTKRSGTED